MADIDKLKLTRSYDRRLKLTDEQRIEIKRIYDKGGTSLNALAREYGVSKRLIQFCVSPDKYVKCRKQFMERRKDGRYAPDRKEWRKIMREHRAYKRKLYEGGEDAFVNE